MLKIHFRLLVLALFGFAIVSCNSSKKSAEEGDTTSADTTSSSIFLVIDSSFFDVIDPNAKLEILAEGFEWSEGPVWVPQINSLLFSDVMTNQVFKWNEESGLGEYLNPSGYTGEIERGAELGSNGLTLNNDGELILCQHGDRRIAKLASSLENPDSDFETIVAEWDGKKFNSPNDVTIASNGNLYFTDPPYGLVKQEKDSSREISFQGVYLVKGSEAILVVDSITRPNGIALTPNEKQIIIANSDSKKIHWYIYDVNEDGTLSNGKIYYDATPYSDDYRGLADGLKIDSQGNVFATGPGGVWVFSPQGKHLGIVLTGQATANCALGPDEKILYITADMYLMKLQMRP